MNRNLRLLLDVVLLAAIGGGAWYAWSTGRLGPNPELEAAAAAAAPAAAIAALAPPDHSFDPLDAPPGDEAFQKLIAAYVARREPLPTADCLDLTASRSPGSGIGPPEAPPEMEGVPGVQGAPAPPYHPVYFARTPRFARDAAVRARQLAQFDRLAQEGFFEARDVTLQYPDGSSVPGRGYTMTRKGWLQDSGGFCFEVAKLRMQRYVGSEKLPEPQDGKTAYKVTIERGISDIEAWASGPEFKDEIDRLTRFSGHRVPIIVLQGPKGLEIARNQQWIEGYGDPRLKLPTQAEIFEVIGMPGVRKFMPQINEFFPGLALPAGDTEDVDEAWDPKTAPAGGPYFAAIYGQPKPHSARLAWLARFKALAELGVMSAEPAEGGFLSRHQYEPGTRFTFKQPMAPAYVKDHLAFFKGGDYVISVVDAGPDPRNYYNRIRFRGVADVRSPAPWFAALKGHPMFPEVTLQFSQAQVFTGAGGWVPGGWGMSHFESAPLRPDLTSLPVGPDAAALPALPPDTVRAHTYFSID